MNVPQGLTINFGNNTYSEGQPLPQEAEKLLDPAVVKAQKDLEAKAAKQAQNPAPAQADPTSSAAS